MGSVSFLGIGFCRIWIDGIESAVVFRALRTELPLNGEGRQGVPQLVQEGAGQGEFVVGKRCGQSIRGGSGK